MSKEKSRWETPLSELMRQITPNDMAYYLLTKMRHVLMGWGIGLLMLGVMFLICGLFDYNTHVKEHDLPMTAATFVHWFLLAAGAFGLIAGKTFDYSIQQWHNDNGVCPVCDAAIKDDKLGMITDTWAQSGALPWWQSCGAPRSPTGFTSSAINSGTPIYRGKS